MSITGLNLPKKPRRSYAQEELQSQIALFDWLRLWESRYPVFKAIYAIPNGANKTPQEGAKMQRSGTRKGVWDIFVSVPHMSPSASHNGLYIEMKSRRGKLTPEQIAFRSLLSRLYRFEVCTSWDDAAWLIVDHLQCSGEHDLIRSLPPRKEPAP